MMPHHNLNNEPSSIIFSRNQYNENSPEETKRHNMPSPNNFKSIMTKDIKQTNMFASTKRLQMNESIELTVQSLKAYRPKLEALEPKLTLER